MFEHTAKKVIKLVVFILLFATNKPLHHFPQIRIVGIEVEQGTKVGDHTVNRGVAVGFLTNGAHMYYYTPMKTTHKPRRVLGRIWNHQRLRKAGLKYREIQAITGYNYGQIWRDVVLYEPISKPVDNNIAK